MNYGEYKTNLADVCQSFLWGMLTPNELKSQIDYLKGVYEGYRDEDGTE